MRRNQNLCCRTQFRCLFADSVNGEGIRWRGGPLEVSQEDSAYSARPLDTSRFNERLLRGSRPCVARDETAGERDRPSQRGPGVARHPLGGPPKKNHCQDDESEHKESHAKENQENQKLR